MIHLAGGTSVKTVFDLEAGKRVFLFVTGALLDDPSTAKGHYTLNVQTDPSPSGNNCSTAIDITRGGSWGSSTVGTGDDYQPGASCTKPHLPGPDRVYTVTSPTTRKYNLRLDTFSGGESQLSLFVMNGCNPQTCATVSMPGSLGGEFTATAGTSYFIVVKGTMSPGNNYILHVEAL